MTSAQEERIRYRIERRLAGRRDVLLHVLVYVLILLSVLLIQTRWDSASAATFAVIWAIPLALHFLRYCHQHGPGARKRAADIEAEIERQSQLSALDQEEEFLIEDRLSRKAAARGYIIAHFLVMAPLLALVGLHLAAGLYRPYEADPWINLTLIWTAIFALHWLRYYFVHGKTAAGRALKIEAEIEREWHKSRTRSRTRRRLLYATADEPDDAALAESGFRIGEDGELIVHQSATDSGRAMTT